MKNKSDFKILAIETSCDETAAAVIGVGRTSNFELRTSKNNRKYPTILSSIVSSQIALHAKTGGVVPEVASRAHMENIIPVIVEALNAVSHKISNQFQNSHDLKINNSNLNKNLELINKKNYSEAISYLKKEIDYIAVTVGPGLIGSLLVGFNAAKTIAYALNKPIIPINHIEGHIYSAFGGEIRNSKSEILNKSQIQNDKNSQKQRNEDYEPVTEIKFPILALTVSGGHTSLTLMENHGVYRTVGQTLDDAAGEAFDKVAQLLDLGYPGGPVVSKLAAQFRNSSQLNGKLKNDKINENCELKIENLRRSLVFPRPIINDGTFNFSFSGLKTAVLQKVLELKKEIYFSCHPEQGKGPQDSSALLQNDINEIKIPEEVKAEICAAFEEAVVDVLVSKTIKAIEKYQTKAVILAGGVAANELLRSSLESRILNLESAVKFLPAPKNLTGDNAAMIGLAAYYHVLRNDLLSWDKIRVDSNLEL